MDMRRAFTLEYWPDAGGFVGRLREVPGVFSQGDTLAELEDNIRDAYSLVLADQVGEARPSVQQKEIEVEV
jgi:predicted RNase H-like HicB family nuclease